MIAESSSSELLAIFVLLVVFGGAFAISPGLGVLFILLAFAFIIIKFMYDAGILLQVLGFFGGLFLLIVLATLSR